VTPPPRYRTDYRLWLAVGVCLFVALGFFNPTGLRGKGGGSLWDAVAVLVTYHDRINFTEMLAPVAIYAAFQAGAAALVGWAVQAVVVVIRSRSTAAMPPT
jgi:hypothetical protein